MVLQKFSFLAFDYIIGAHLASSWANQRAAGINLRRMVSCQLFKIKFRRRSLKIKAMNIVPIKISVEKARPILLGLGFC